MHTAMDPHRHAERSWLLSFAASFLWADLEVDRQEQAFFVELARELGSAEPDLEAASLLAAPPPPEAVDPASVPPRLAAAVRQVALRAIASDGRVDDAEMELFFLLDALLPADLPPAAGRATTPGAHEGAG